MDEFLSASYLVSCPSESCRVTTYDVWKTNKPVYPIFYLYIYSSKEVLHQLIFFLILKS